MGLHRKFKIYKFYDTIYKPPTKILVLRVRLNHLRVLRLGGDQRSILNRSGREQKLVNKGHHVLISLNIAIYGVVVWTGGVVSIYGNALY